MPETLRDTRLRHELLQYQHLSRSSRYAWRHKYPCDGMNGLTGAVPRAARRLCACAFSFKTLAIMRVSCGGEGEYCEVTQGVETGYKKELANDLLYGIVRHSL